MKIGIYQCACGGMDPGERIGRLSKAIYGLGLDLVLCPELFLSGYNVALI